MADRGQKNNHPLYFVEAYLDRLCVLLLPYHKRIKHETRSTGTEPRSPVLSLLTVHFSPKKRARCLHKHPALSHSPVFLLSPAKQRIPHDNRNLLTAAV